VADFELAFQKLLKDEGGFVNDKADSGGATNLGISLNFLKGLHRDINGDHVIDVNDIRDLTPDIVRPIYKTAFWDYSGSIDSIKSQSIANLLFGMRVNMGVISANKLLQQSVYHAVLDDDGIIGPESINAINSIRPAPLLEDYKSSLRQRYQAIVQKNPQDEKFLPGWFNRLATYI
jgi:lysozyme family protein